MEWLDRWTYDKKLKTSFIIYMVIFLILGLSFTQIVETLIEGYIADIQSQYLRKEVIEEGKEIITYFRLNLEGPTEVQRKLVKIFGLYKEFAIIINISIFSILGFSLYFRDKIEKPIDELKYAGLVIESHSLVKKEAHRDEMLYFSNNYNQIIDSLKIEKKGIWKEIDEMEKMLSSFEHDIRTPITIIRGYNDMILKYYPEGKMNDKKLEETLLNMRTQIDRLDEYINRMGSLKSSKQVKLNIKSIETKDLLNNMEKIGKALSKEKLFKVNSNLKAMELNLDENLILEAYENILVNGFRHAKNTVEVDVGEDKDHLIIEIQDDGEGFTKEGLKYGTVAFFTENKSNGKNMGLGLNIAKELCEKHMGTINLSNNTRGGLVEMKIEKLNNKS